MIKILFVCHGNICRSPMAEFVMKDLIRQAGMTDEFAIASAATSREEKRSAIRCITAPETDWRVRAYPWKESGRGR